VHGRALIFGAEPGFQLGPGLLALRKLRATTILSATGQMMYIRRRSPRGDIC